MDIINLVHSYKSKLYFNYSLDIVISTKRILKHAVHSQCIKGIHI